MSKPKVIVCACLFGHPVRYDGMARPFSAAQTRKLSTLFQVIPVCPECLGGLQVPRPAAEIVGGSGADVLSAKARVRTAQGEDQTEAFVAGARSVLECALKHQVQFAILKANSPSCGTSQHYDGSFCGKLRPGQGVTAALLQRHGIQLISEENLQIEQLADALCQTE